MKNIIEKILLTGVFSFMIFLGFKALIIIDKVSFIIFGFFGSTIALCIILIIGLWWKNSHKSSTTKSRETKK